MPEPRDEIRGSPGNADESELAGAMHILDGIADGLVILTPKIGRRRTRRSGPRTRRARRSGWCIGSGNATASTDG
jgi:hypothetical protein